MKCDLHVHSVHSGMCTTPLVGRICRESYTQPQEVYAALKERGMDLITITDHDSIGAAEELRGYGDFFVSEEVTCRMPGGTTMHIGIYDISERQHIEIQKRRDDLPALLAYVTERRLLFTVNHMFSSVTGRRKIEDFAMFDRYFPAFETRSGQMPAFHNRLAEEFARRAGRACVGGSDSHALPSAGRAYTEVRGARGKDEFLAGIRAGRATAEGNHGGYFGLTRDVLLVVGKMMQESPWTAFLSPLALLVPVATATTLIEETIFARYWNRRLRREASDTEARGADEFPRAFGARGQAKEVPA